MGWHRARFHLNTHLSFCCMVHSTQPNHRPCCMPVCLSERERSPVEHPYFSLSLVFPVLVFVIHAFPMASIVPRFLPLQSTPLPFPWGSLSWLIGGINLHDFPVKKMSPDVACQCVSESDCSVLGLVLLGFVFCFVFLVVGGWVCLFLQEVYFAQH